MPGLDVSFMVVDPMLSTTVSIKRRAQTVDAKGRATNTPTLIPDVVGVLTQREPSDLERAADGDVVMNRITFCTKMQIYDALSGFAPDVIVWKGMDYLVTQSLPYSEFGAGVYEVHAEAMKQPAVAQ